MDHCRVDLWGGGRWCVSGAGCRWYRMPGVKVHVGCNRCGCEDDVGV